MMNAKQNTITGGKTGFIAAIDRAYGPHGQAAHSPSIRYSHARGFFVESAMIPADSDVIWEETAMFHASNGKRTIRPSDYADVRNAILNG